MHLSVVLPCLQAGTSLERTLESLLVQEQAVAEIVVAGVLSPDVQNPLEEEFRPRFPGTLRLLPLSAPLNTVDVWNKGVAACTGEWVSILTPETTVRPNFVRALAEAAERSADASVLRAGWTRERPRGAGPAEQHTLLSVRTVTHPAEALFEQRFGPKASTCAAAVRRGTWNRMGGVPPEIELLGDWIGDWALWLTAGAVGDTVRSPEVIADLHANSVSTNKAEEMREMYLIYRDILPRAARTAALSDPTWIASASRKRFRDVTIAASNDLRPGATQERQVLSAALADWAASVEQQPLLERLRSGEKIRSFTLGKKMKPAFRRVVAAVR